MIRKTLVTVGAVALTLGGGAAALASGSASPAVASAVIHGCESTSTRVLYEAPGARHLNPCPKGQVAVTWNVTGPAGPQGATGATGATGPQGPQGPAGASAVQSIQASTTFTNWPESSGWANDAFTRTLSLTLQHAAPSAKCGGTPVCFFYTGTLTDNGGFTTVDGAASPNGSSTDKIKGAWTGTMVGTADFEFYASSSTFSAANVPVSATGSQKSATFNTTDWAEQAFGPGVTFAGGPNLTAYDWDYNVTVTCGTNASQHEAWNDGINPGDDGQGAGDGNITGATACTG